MALIFLFFVVGFNKISIFATNLQLQLIYLMDTEVNLKDDKARKLLEDFHDGKPSAFASLYNMYIDMMLNYGHCLTTNTELIKDCVHDVFVKLMDKHASCDVKRISSYLIISLRNRLVDEFRRNTFTIETPVEEVYFDRTANDVEHEYLHQESIRRRHNHVNYLLNSLTPRQRKAFQLYFIEERKYDEICELMHMNYHSVRNLVHRGMLRLRQEVG